MTTSSPARRLRLWRAVVAPAAVLLLLALSGAAFGSAEVGNFHSQLRSARGLHPREGDTRQGGHTPSSWRSPSAASAACATSPGG
jgi:hypothetical protein